MNIEYDFDNFEAAKDQRIYSTSTAIRKFGKQKFTAYIADRRSLEFSSQLGNFQNQIEIMGSIVHELVQDYVESVIINEKILLIVEFESKPFFSIYENGIALEEDVAKSMFHNLITAIDFLHKNNIVHLDIRPESLFYNSKNSLKLCNFFCARRLSNENEKISERYGTLNYQAPEIFAELPYDPKKADIWACGVLLVSALLHQSLFKSKSMEEIKEKIVNFKFTSFPSFPAGANDVLKRILDSDPTKRPTTNEILNMEWFK